MQCRYYGSKGILFVVRYVYVVTVKAAKHNNVRSKTVKKRLNFVGEKCRGTRVFILVGKMTLSLESLEREYWHIYNIKHVHVFYCRVSSLSLFCTPLHMNLPILVR